MSCDIFFGDQSHGYQIAKACGCRYSPEHDIVISRAIDNQLAGGVVYTDFNPGGSIGVHFAGFHPRWIHRELIWVCFDFPFNQLKVKKVFAQVPANKPEVVELDMRFGFLRPTIIKDVFADCDLVLLDMYRHECKWLNNVPKLYQKGNPDG